MNTRIDNAVAVRAFKATCGHPVKAGERCSRRRERALSYAHARAANTMYPVKTRCLRCLHRAAAIDLARHLCGYYGPL